MTVREVVRKNPLKVIFGSISIGTVLFTVLGTLFTDARYIHAADFEKYKVQNAEVIRDLQKQVNELSKR
jgi:nucleoid-associated protein YgaU